MNTSKIIYMWNILTENKLETGRRTPVQPRLGPLYNQGYEKDTQVIG